MEAEDLSNGTKENQPYGIQTEELGAENKSE